MIEEGLTTLLTTDSALNALIAGRVYALLAPQSTPQPFMVFFKISDVASGGYCAQDPMVLSAFQFDSYATSFKEALRIAAALRSALIDFRGPMGSTHVGSIRQEGELQLLDPEPGLFRVSTTLFIWHSNLTE